MHKNYLEFSAKTNYDLGLQMGRAFRKEASGRVRPLDQEEAELSKQLLKVTEKHFPQYIEELRGYSEGAGVDFLELWSVSLEDDLSNLSEKCTFGATNGGELLFHNEDWEKGSEDAISLVKKEINGLIILELYYHNTLGGNSISINSNGYVHSINSLSHKDYQIGVPRNVIARFLSETSDPVEDFEKIKQIPRASGYNHNIVGVDGIVYDIEMSATEQVLKTPEVPYVHTNHFLTELSKFENTDNSSATQERFKSASAGLVSTMTAEEIMKLSSDQKNGQAKSIFNERTIGKMVVDLGNLDAFVWLLREKEDGWMEYNLDFIKQ